MTFVGKILVIVILVLSLLFLAFSTVIFSASKNWKQAHDNVSQQLRDLRSELTAEQQRLAAREQELEQETGARDAQIATLNQVKTRLEAEIRDLQARTTDVVSQLEVAQQTAQSSVAEARDRAQETDVLRERFQAVQKQANDLVAQRTELNERIRILERQVQVAQQNNRDLRENVADYRNFLESRGLPSDPVQIRQVASGIEAPPDIEGRVTRVNTRGDVIEVSIGSDDGVVAGQRYFVFRTGDTSEYIGEINIFRTEPEKSAAQFTKPYLGRRIQENDIVAAKIQPRS
ncbi:hypothetical protein BH23PLA1_BH23PLA1_12530 [soil metagenome]